MHVQVVVLVQHVDGLVAPLEEGTEAEVGALQDDERYNYACALFAVILVLSLQLRCAELCGCEALTTSNNRTHTKAPGHWQHQGQPGTEGEGLPQGAAA